MISGGLGRRLTHVSTQKLFALKEMGICATKPENDDFHTSNIGETAEPDVVAQELPRLSESESEHVALVAMTNCV